MELLIVRKRSDNHIFYILYHKYCSWYRLLMFIFPMDLPESYGANSNSTSINIRQDFLDVRSFILFSITKKDYDSSIPGRTQYLHYCRNNVPLIWLLPFWKKICPLYILKNQIYIETTLNTASDTSRSFSLCW